MKSAQSLTAGWLSQLPRDRRNVLLAAFVLTGILGSLVLYGRWQQEMRIPSGSGADTAARAAATERAAGAPAEAPAMGTAPAAEDTPSAVGADAPAPVAAEADLAAAQSEQAYGTAGSEAPEPEPVRLQMPLAGDPPILQPYQFAFSPIYEDYRLHPGIDFAAAEGEQVLAAAPGTVAAIEVDPAEGTALVLDHGGGLMTRYAGLGKVSVRKGARVEAGSPLGTVGRPAGGAQPSLHFEVRQDGESLDPSPYLFQ